MRIGICDDLAEERSLLRQMLLSHTPSFIISEYSCGEELLAGLAQGDQLDLLFLDICMGDLNGIETAEKIRLEHENLPILFLTTSPQFAVDSYRVQAQDYLLKPVANEWLVQSLDRQLARLKQQEAHILLQTSHGILRMPLSHILYVEAMTRKVNVLQTDGSVTECMDTMQNLETTLEIHGQFVRPHRSYLVNLHHVKRLDRDGFHMEGGGFVPIARNNMAAMKRQYMGQMLRV